MWLRVRTMDGKQSFQVDSLSKLTKIEDFREKLVDDLGVAPSRQKLYFCGKQVHLH